MKNQIQIRILIKEDIVAISGTFNQIGWNKPASIFEGYSKEQEVGARIVWVAYVLCHPREKGSLILLCLYCKIRGRFLYETS